MKEIMKFSELEYAKKQGGGLNLDALKQRKNKNKVVENNTKQQANINNDFELAPLEPPKKNAGLIRDLSAGKDNWSPTPKTTKNKA